MGTLNGSSRVTLDGTFTGSGALNNPVVSMSSGSDLGFLQNWANGTGNNQANQFWQISTTANATTDTYELDDASLTDDFGTALTFTAIKELIVINKSTSAGFLITVGGDFMTGAVKGNQQVDPGGRYNITNPITEYAVTNTVSDTLTIASAANVVPYVLILIGTV